MAILANINLYFLTNLYNVININEQNFILCAED